MFAIMDLDEAKAVTADMKLTPSRANIRRVVRAHDLVNRNHVRLQADFGDEQIWLIMSQNNPSEVYTVRRNGKVQCTCPDHQKTGEPCKHGISVILAEQKACEDAMVAEWEDEESNRFACDGYELY